MKSPTPLHKLKSSDIYPALICTLLFILALIVRWRVFYDFCLVFTDCDQLLLWDVANDMHHGIFHEPCFYGQSYNPLIEPLFAQVFLIFRMPLQVALPLISWIFGFFPYLLLGWAFFREKKYLSVAFTFVYLLWLPIEFQAIDSMPRGYVPASAFASIGVYMALFTQKKSRFFWFAFFSLFAFTVSQNCIFFIVPVALYLWLDHLKDFKYYVQTFVGIVAALPLPLFIYWFYNRHPEYIVHGIEYTFDFNTFKESLKQTDKIFNFLVAGHGFKLLIISLGFSIFALACFIKKNIKAGISIMGGLAVLYFSLWFDKAQDGTQSLFFSSIRMYLGVPVGIIIFSYWTESSFKIKSFRGALEIISLTFLLAVGIVCSAERNWFFKDHLYNSADAEDIVSSQTTSGLEAYCSGLSVLCRNYHTDLIILNNNQAGAAYMCAAFNYPFEVLRPCYERRTWTLQHEDSTIRRDFIYLPANPDTVYKFAAGIDLKPTYDATAFLITTRGRKVFDILKDLKEEVRAH